MDFAKKYWSSGEFTNSDGEAYSGYVGILDSKGYTYDTEELLTGNSNWSTQINCSDYYFDRILDEDLELPYNKSQVSVHANDFLNKSVIKNILTRLQTNNDYIFKSAILSDTLIPAIDDCSLYATQDFSDYYFCYTYEDNEGNIFTEKVKTITYDNKQDIINAMLINPYYDSSLPFAGINSDGSSGCTYTKILKTKKGVDADYTYSEEDGYIRGDDGFLYDTEGYLYEDNEYVYEYVEMKYCFPLFTSDTGNLEVGASQSPAESYGNYLYIPYTVYQEELNYGILSRNNLSDIKTTKTALDPTFYPIEGKEDQMKFNFHEITSTKLVISSMGIDEVYGKYANLIVFIVFQTQVLIFKLKYYVDNFEGNKNNTDILDFITIDKTATDPTYRNAEGNIIYFDTVDTWTKNSLKFLNLTDVEIYKDNMYLTDSKLNMVLRYDISWLLSDGDEENDMFDIKNIRLLGNMQGDGDINSNIYFNAPKAVSANDDYVYIVDSGNNCIKVYTPSLDYVRTIKNSKFATNNIETVAINPYVMTLSDGTELTKGSLWVFSTNGTALYVTVLDGGVVLYHSNIAKISLLEDAYTWDEEFKSVEFSVNNSNYIYISTTKRVYKVHLSKPNYPFASLSYFKQRVILSTMVWQSVPYSWHILPAAGSDSGIDITWSYRPSSTSAEVLDNKAFCLTGNDSMEYIEGTEEYEQFNGDIIFHIGTLYDQSAVDTYITRNNITFDQIPQDELAEMINCSGLFLYNETTSYISSVTTPFVPCYLIDDIEDIFTGEYINPITFNKCAYKVIYNLVNLKNILIGYFQGGYNLDNLMVYDQLVYTDYFQNLRIEDNNDFFIHDNEPTSIILNRIFEHIYNLQVLFLKNMKSRYIASPNLTNNSFRII